DAEHERPEPPRAAPLALRVAGDHELLAAVRLDLQPLARALARSVGAVDSLGDDSFEALLPGRLVQAESVLERLRDAYRRVSPVEQPLQPRTPVRERKVDERLAFELQHVEHLVDDRRPGFALLHGREARAPFFVQRADLAVEDDCGRLHRTRNRAGDSTKALGQIVAVSADERYLTGTDVCDRPVPVPLHLEQPTRPLRNLLDERREHRLVPGRAGAGRVGPAAVLLLALADDQPVLRVAI